MISKKKLRILILDDEPMIALNLEEILIDAGFTIAAVVHKIDKALAVIEGGACDFAIIDANLAGVSASPAASALAKRGLPFIVVSGYSRKQLQVNFPGAHFLQKPFQPTQIIQAISAMVLKHQGLTTAKGEI